MSTKTPIVFLHGLMGSGATWSPVARLLENEFDVLTPDARGHGQSTLPLLRYGYEHLADDVVSLLPERSVLVGHSMGGMTAAVVASRGGGLLRGLVLVDPTFLSPERQREVFESDVAEQHRKTLALSKSELVAQMRAQKPNRSDEIIELQADARLRTHMATFEILKPPNPDYRALVRAFDVPTLLVIGDAPVVTMQQAEELRMLNPLVKIEQIEDAGHGLPFDQPARLAAAIAAFLSLFALMALVGCGGAATPPSTPAPTGESAGAKCLAIAGAQRTKKPNEPATISAKHVLVKYKGAKRAPDTVTRSREEACLRASEARSKLEAGASFEDVVKDYSEEPGAATREGSVGSITRADVAAPFADAAFELAPGEVSHVVETDFGFHVILRTP